MAELQAAGTIRAGVAKPRSDELERQFEQLRPQLTGYCYRMLGSAFEAEDAVQETMLRAWRSFDRFEGRSALSSWLYRIATNVCLTLLDGRNRRAGCRQPRSRPGAASGAFVFAQAPPQTLGTVARRSADSAPSPGTPLILQNA